MPQFEKTEHGIDFSPVAEAKHSPVKQVTGMELCEDQPRLTSFLKDLPLTLVDSGNLNGEITEQVVASNIRNCIDYIEACLNQNTTDFFENGFEEASRAEQSSAQLWHWIHDRSMMADGGRVNELLVKSLLKRELDALEIALGESEFHSRQYSLASEIFGRAVRGKQTPNFLTKLALNYLRYDRKENLQHESD